VDRQGDVVYVREKLAASGPLRTGATHARPGPESVVIVGGGAAGLAAADMLRREGYDGPVTMVSADDSPPCDRPNLSKDYLAGSAQEDWIPLRPAEFYAEHRIELLLRSRVASIDARARSVLLDTGRSLRFGALLIATGADPVHLPIPGAGESQVYYLRSFADSRAIVARAAATKHAVVIGASFIGLEVSASLRARGVDVDVVAREALPLERVMGPQLGTAVKRLHEAHGVVFHLGQTVTAVDGRAVRLSGGTTLNADFVVIGAGVRPSTSLAEAAGLAVDRGIVVNEHLETSAPGIFAAGDVARWPSRRFGQPIRVEHWVVAERQGQAAARNILGHRDPFDAVPFFWSQHYDVTVNYVGHAETWDAVDVHGDVDAHDCSVTFKRGDRRLAVATMSRDRDSLHAEIDMERGA
jgi:NADPH-dependent 2,4-dienoyl-CoA reductase/sulfur reductase-like enzyme